MPRGAAVIAYKGKRGTVWRAKYIDSTGRQVMETLGREDEGWTRKAAQQALRERLVDVKREGLRKADPTRFGAFVDGWLQAYTTSRELKRSTVEGYEQIVAKHLRPAFADGLVSAIDEDKLERYVAEKISDGYSGRTINRHLNLLSLIFRAAMRRKLIRTNPVPNIERPKEGRRRWTILDPSEIARVERAFNDLIDAAPAGSEERRWNEQARVVFLTIVGSGLRRDELLGLRWRDIKLADPAGPSLRVRATFVGGADDTPKSEAGERTIALGGRLAGELFDHRGRSAYSGEDERVFVSPTKGTPMDVVRYANTFRAALAKAKIDRPMRPFHDGRHTSIMNSAAASIGPAALKARAGHASFQTTELYIDLAGEQFREEAERHEQRVFG
jgi:integrase